MYKALKSAQNEIQEALLKFVDEAASAKPESRCPRGEPCQCALITQSVTRSHVNTVVPSSSAVPLAAPSAVPSAVPAFNDTSCKCSPKEYDSRFEELQNNLQFLHQKQNAQYEAIMTSIQNMNMNIANIVKILSQQTVETATTIPNLQPTAQGSDLKNVCVDVSHVGVLAPEPPMTLETPREIDEEEQSAIAGDITPDIEEDEEEVEEEVEEDAEVEVVPEEAEDVVPDDAEEEGIEVEEWTYKGRQFFKDSENTVYANNNGELGDPIGLYDPVKNVVKKIPAA